MRYALIGLAPYTFHYDETKTYGSWRAMQYFIAFNDLRNFWMPVEDYRKIFREEFLSQKLPLEPFDVNNVSFEKPPLMFMNCNSRLNTRKDAENWHKKNYPATCAENIKILDDYLTLCEKNSCRAIMFLPQLPKGYKKYFSKQKLDEFRFLVYEALKKHSTARFFDGWQQIPDFLDTDFYDSTHLNLQGAAKFSAYFNLFIEQIS